MGRQDTRQAVRTIKARVRANRFSITPCAYEFMVEAMVYEEDVKRAVSNGRIVSLIPDGDTPAGYALIGFDMNERPLGVVCRQARTRVEIVDIFTP